MHIEQQGLIQHPSQLLRVGPAKVIQSRNAHATAVPLVVEQHPLEHLECGGHLNHRMSLRRSINGTRQKAVSSLLVAACHGTQDGRMADLRERRCGLASQKMAPAGE